MFGGGRVNQRPRPIFIVNQEVEIVKFSKYLGSLLDEGLPFCECYFFLQESLTTTFPTEKAENFRC